MTPDGIGGASAADAGVDAQAATPPDAESIITNPVVAQVLAEFEKLDGLPAAEAADVLAQGVQQLEAILAKNSGG